MDLEASGLPRAALGWAGAGLLTVGLVVASCGRSSDPGASHTAAPRAARPATAAPALGGGALDSGSGTTFKIAFLGDSVTAGLGILTDQAYPADIERLFLNDGYSEVEVVNAGVSGDTTAGGLRRLDDALDPGVRIVVVALGGNDALRGLNPQQTHDNLSAIIRAAQKRNVQVVLVGMLAPPNLGPDYRDAFAKVYTDLAAEYQKTMVSIPFLLDGVAGNPALNQADGIHPTAEGAKIIADHLYPPLRNLVDSMQ